MYKRQEYVDEENKTRWNFATLEEVQQNVYSTTYNKSLIRFVKGKVEDTLQEQDNLPAQITVLRLDTDWFQSTKTELDVLFPRLVKGGYLIIDDYCTWGGSRAATDEWLKTHEAELCDVRSRTALMKHPECFTAKKC